MSLASFNLGLQLTLLKDFVMKVKKNALTAIGFFVYGLRALLLIIAATFMAMHQRLLILKTSHSMSAMDRHTWGTQYALRWLSWLV